MMHISIAPNTENAKERLCMQYRMTYTAEEFVNKLKRSVKRMASKISADEQSDDQDFA